MRCKYCYEKSMKEFENGLEKRWDYDVSPVDSEVLISKLKKLIKPEDTLIFYGGEPLLKIDKIKEIMDNLDCKFYIQTNGKLLNLLPDEYLLKLGKILISIDGTRERDIAGKGAGHYDLVMKNIDLIRSKGFNGEIVARMVITKPDVYEQVKHLIDTGKESPSHRELMNEAICFGWIDTTINRLDEERYIRNFSRRNKNSRWSDNTISYGKELIKQGRMAPAGLKFYEEGLKKPTHDAGIPKNPPMPEELKKALDKNPQAKENFNSFAPSIKKMYYRGILRGKREETRTKRINSIVEAAKAGKKNLLGTQDKINN
jgi:uncharacterized protein YdeI (YjbR/CyaY-like superfamily)